MCGQGALLAFGCLPFGARSDETASSGVFATCRAARIRQFDSAHLHGAGESERTLRRWRAGGRGHARGAGADVLRAAFGVSRRRLGMDAVDLLSLRRFEPATSLEKTLEPLAGFQDDGLIRRIGVSGFAAWQMMKAQAIAARPGTRIDAIRPMPVRRCTPGCRAESTPLVAPGG